MLYFHPNMLNWVTGERGRLSRSASDSSSSSISASRWLTSRPPQRAGTGNQVPKHILLKQELSGTFWQKSRSFFMTGFELVIKYLHKLLLKELGKVHVLQCQTAPSTYNIFFFFRIVRWGGQVGESWVELGLWQFSCLQNCMIFIIFALCDFEENLK